jgi:hypothetical protein
LLPGLQPTPFTSHASMSRAKTTSRLRIILSRTYIKYFNLTGCFQWEVSFLFAQNKYKYWACNYFWCYYVILFQHYTNVIIRKFLYSQTTFHRVLVSANIIFREVHLHEANYHYLKPSYHKRKFIAVSGLWRCASMMMVLAATSTRWNVLWLCKNFRTLVRA